jgi:hypothetical protein
VAAELIGTAYVRIKAITTGLAKDISDGVDKGVKDSQSDTDKAGEGIGDSLGKGAGKGMKGSLGDSVSEALDSPEIDKASEDTGKRVSENVKKGHEDENKKRNPFSSLVDSLTNIGKKFKFPGLKKAIDDSDIDTESEGAGHRMASGIRKGVDDENDKKNPFKSLIDSLEKVTKMLPGLPGGKSILAFLLPDALGAAGTLLQAALAPALAILGNITTAALGAGVALGGVAAVALPGFGVLMAALKTDTKELQKFKKAAEGLLKPWKNVAVETQKTLLPGLQDALGTMQDLVPLFSKFGGVIGGIGADFARMASQVLVSNKSLDAMSLILEDSSLFFANIRDAGLNMVQTILPLFAAMSPLAVQLSASLKTMAEHFNTFIQAKSESGELTSTFQTWYDRLATIMRILGDLGMSLFNVLSIGAEWGDSMFVSLEKMTNKWREFTSSEAGQSKIKAWFDEMKPLAHELWLLFKDIADIVIAPTFDGTKTQAMTDFVHEIRVDWLPILKDLMTALAGQGLGDALKGLADAFIELIGAAGGTGTLTSTIGTLTMAIDGLATLLSNPVVQAVAPTLVTLAGAITVFGWIAGPVVKIAGALETLWGVFTFIAGGTALGVIVGVFIAIAIAVGAFIAVWKNWDTINDALASAWEWFTKLSGPMKIVVGVLAALVALAMGPLAAGAAALYGLVWVFKNFEKIKEWVLGAWEAVKEFVTNLPETLSKLPGQILGALGSLGDTFKELPSIIGGALSGLADSIGGWLSGVPDAIGSALSSVGTVLKTALLDGIRALPSALLDGVALMYDVGVAILGFLADGLMYGLPKLVQFFVELPVKILGILGSIGATLLEVGVSILKFLIEGLVQGLPKVLAFFLKLPFEIATLARKAIQGMIELGIDMLVALAQGLVSAAPRVWTWFQNLPTNIMNAVVGAISWLLQLGADIISGLYNGLVNNWSTILGWLISIPGLIISGVGSALTWLWGLGGELIQGLWNGALEVWASMNEFLVGLPNAALTAIGDLFGTIWNGIVAGKDLFVANVSGWIDSLITFFTNLPGQAVTAIGDIGGTIWSAIAGGFATALSNIGTWVSDAWGKLSDFASEAPGKVAGLVTSLPGKIGEATSSALTKLGTWVTDALNKIGEFVSGVPGKLLDLASKMTTSIGSATSSALITIGNWVTDALNKVGTFVAGIPGKLAGFASDLTSGVTGLLKRAWNAAVDKLPSINFDPPGPGSISIDPGSFMKWHAMGAVIPGSTMGTIVGVGEGGRAEAIVPMTRPARALAVMQEAGLDKLILRSYLGGTVNKSYATSDVTMLRIDKANIVSPVDTDMVVQKIASAYRRAS